MQDPDSIMLQSSLQVSQRPGTSLIAANSQRQKKKRECKHLIILIEFWGAPKKEEIIFVIFVIFQILIN